MASRTEDMTFAKLLEYLEKLGVNVSLLFVKIGRLVMVGAVIRSADRIGAALYRVADEELLLAELGAQGLERLL